MKNMILTLCGVLAASSAAAGGQTPYLSSDQNPFIQIYTLPPPQGGGVPDRGRREFALLLELANNSIAEGDADEDLVLDGETYRASLIYRRGVAESWEAGLIVPLVLHRPGIFDNFIESWHDAFGLSNRKRTAFENNRLNFSYTRDGTGPVTVTRAATGLGDIRLITGYRLGRAEDGRRLALRAGLKLPTGDSATLRGSGSTDVSLGLDATDERTLASWKTTLSWSAGLLYLGRGEVLDGLRRDVIFVGSLGAARPLGRRLSVKAQLDGHSSFYDSDLEALGADAIQFTLGGGMELANRNAIDFALVENLFSDTTPDLVFHLAWRKVL